MKLNVGTLSRISESVIEYILTCDIGELESLTVNSIARKFCKNRSYLSQRFKVDKEYSLHDYIVLIKIFRSLSLLERDEAMTVEKLARQMGFSSADYFTRVFKRFIGTTPGKYKSFCKQMLNGGK